LVQVETAKVQPLKDALSEEQWRQYNADLAAEAEAGKQAEEAAEQGRQLAEAQAAEQRAAEEAEAERQSKLTKVCHHKHCLHSHLHLHLHFVLP
jgi:hypothetical protein